MSPYFARLKFSDVQLDALRQIYYKHFDPKMPTDYKGAGTAVFWGENDVWPDPISAKFIEYTAIRGTVVKEANSDPLWEVFGDLLPHMSTTSVITKMYGPAEMCIHKDRDWRPNAIYFPITVNSDCVSSYYKVGNSDYNQPEKSVPSVVMDKSKAVEIASYRIDTNAYLTNVHEFHGVKNYDSDPRIAMGWNFKENLSFEEHFKILDSLNLIDNN